METTMMSDWVDHDGGVCPIENKEQMVIVEWREDDGQTHHRAGALNWKIVKRYRLAANPWFTQ